MKKMLSRRQALRGVLLSTAGATALRAKAEPAASSPPAAGSPQGLCLLTPQAVEGPFYFDPKLMRADIAEGRPGAAVELVFRVIATGPCTPISGVRVDVWHADAEGIYSGYGRQGDDGSRSTKGETYLRGTQVTNSDGRVTFRTIFPGWYPGRTPHVHLKVILNEMTASTGQVYFPDDLSARIYRTKAPYTARPTPDTTNARDFIFQSGEREGGGTVLAVTESPDLLTATLLIAIDPSGTATR